MRNNIYLLFLMLAVGLMSCKKSNTQPATIKEYDDAQIKAYISANGYTKMQRDTVGGDTTGIYYEILTQGTGAPVDYSSYLSLTFTARTLDGSYSKGDTIANHKYTILGGISPTGLQIALHDLVPKMGARLHIIVPSHLGYGTDGTGTGTNKIGGNKSLEYYVNVVNNVTTLNGVTYANNMNTYDDISIQKYMAANGSTGFTKTASGLYYKIKKAGSGTAAITSSSTVNFSFRIVLLNGTVVDPINYTSTSTVNADNTTYNLTSTTGQITALREAILLAGRAGTEMTIISPSNLAYGLPTVSGSYPAHSCIFYFITIESVTE